MNGNPTSLPHVGRRPKPPKSEPAARPSMPASLSRGLTNSLRRKLYAGLYQGSAIRATPSLDRLPIYVETSRLGTPLSGIMVRKVALVSGEHISHTFSSEQGLIPNPLEEGRMLVLTNKRVIGFGQKDGMRETVLMPIEEVKAVAVKAGQRSKGNLFQGGLMIVAAVFFYVLLAYWLTGRIDGPTVPVIRMDLVAFVVFLAILTGVGMMAQIYFAKPDGEVTFQGDGVKLTFPFRGETAEDDIYQLVNAAFSTRETVVGESGLGYSGLEPPQIH